MARIAVKRIYEEAAKSDGKRILVDRIWPRGVSKEKADLYEWCKDVAPTDGLRKWYEHDPAKFESFRTRYKKELETKKRTEALDHIRELAESSKVTLLTGSKAVDISQAAVLAAILNGD